MDIYICIYIYIYTCIYTASLQGALRSGTRAGRAVSEALTPMMLAKTRVLVDAFAKDKGITLDEPAFVPADE